MCRTQPQLALDVGLVSFDGLDAEIELACDLTAGNALTDEFEDLLPHLQFMLLWLSNGFELLNFLRTRMHQYVLDPLTSLPRETRSSVAEADREIVAVLEEIVLCTFQQTVYHITKVSMYFFVLSSYTGSSSFL